MKTAILMAICALLPTYSMALDVSGEYEASYKSLFSKNVLEISLEATAREGGPLKDITIKSEELGTCTNLSHLNSSSQYGYLVTEAIPFILTSEKEVHRIHSTIFCKSGWYVIGIEIPMNAFKSSDQTQAGIFIDNSSFKKIFQKKVVLTKIR